MPFQSKSLIQGHSFPATINQELYNNLRVRTTENSWNIEICLHGIWTPIQRSHDTGNSAPATIEDLNTPLDFNSFKNDTNNL